MTPSLFLAVAVGITLLAVLLQVMVRRRQMRRVARLAAEQRMNYVARDRLHLAERVAELFPVPGVADVRVFDVIYGSRDGGRRYVFTVEYTVGVVHTKRRLRRAAALEEPRQRQPDSPPLLQLAPEDLPSIEQYRALAKALAAEAPATVPG